MLPGAISTALQTIATVVNKVKSVTAFTEDKSLSDITKLTRVEPLTIISRELSNKEYLLDINQSLVNLFAAYYLQAVAILTKVNNVEVIKILDRLTPDRDETGFLLMGGPATEGINNLVMENYKFTLPMGKNISLEDKDSSGITLTESVNLSVGKLIHVDIRVPDDKGDSTSVKIPINLRLMVSMVNENTVVNLLTRGEGVYSDWDERKALWKANRISLIKDLIWGQDLMDAEKKMIIEDDTGTTAEMIKRVNNARKFGLITDNPSLATASNIFVITEQEADAIGRKLGGKLANPTIRAKAFKATYAMIIVVVDREAERITIYTRNVSSATDLSIKEIKSANKGRGPDIGDLLKSMQMGSPISF